MLSNGLDKGKLVSKDLAQDGLVTSSYIWGYFV